MIDVTDEPEVEPATRVRAQPMAPEDRRRMIAEQAVPLFLEHGASLTTRQLAEHLGIAEGTIFRAFGDKDALVRAAVETFMELSLSRMADGIVDPALPLEEKVGALVRGTREWMQHLFRMLSLVPREDVPQLMREHGPGGSADAYRAAVTTAFLPDAPELTIPIDRLPSVMGIAGMAANAERFGDADALTDDELVQFILYGIAGGPRGTTTRGKE